MAKHKEGKVEEYFAEQVEAHGGLCRKVKWLCRRGCPDRFWSFRNSKLGPTSGLAEIKPPGTPPRPHQDREIERLRANGTVVFVIDSFEAVDDFIRIYRDDQ